MTISAIICTLGRMECLPECLAAIRGQTRRPDEIVVVLAPGADRAARWLAEQPDVKLVRVDRRNISASRNAGADAASGEVLAFCDDDAVARADWLEHLAAPLGRPEVGAAGGAVLQGQAEPYDVAFRNGVARLSGRQVSVREEPGRPGGDGPWYNVVCGCSFAVRRDALRQVGSFDDFIEFGYDETDLCVRLGQAGWTVAHAPRSVVVHRPQPGGFRVDGLRRDWFCEMKNQMYSGLKNRTGIASALRTAGRGAARLLKLSCRFAAGVWRRRLASGEARRMLARAVRGYLAGLRAGLPRRARGEVVRRGRP